MSRSPGSAGQADAAGPDGVDGASGAAAAGCSGEGSRSGVRVLAGIFPAFQIRIIRNDRVRPWRPCSHQAPAGLVVPRGSDIPVLYRIPAGHQAFIPATGVVSPVREYAFKINFVINGTEFRGVITDWGGVLTTPILTTVQAWIQADAIDWDSYRVIMRTWLMEAYGPDGSRNPVHALD